MTQKANIVLAKGEVLRNKNVIEFHFYDNVVLEPEDIEEMNKASTILCQGETLPHLIVPGLHMTASKEARETDIMEQRAKNTLCEAIVLNNLAIRLVATLYYRFNPTPFETKQFKSIESARRWIAQQGKK